MKEEYIETLLAQIREKRARERVRCEVEAHIDDQKEAYISEGYSWKESEEKAVKDMGDPVEAGVALDLVHRPKPAWGFLAVIAVLCAVGVILQYTAVSLNEADKYFFRNQCFYAVLGFSVLIGIYYIDYTRIAKYSRQLCAGILLILFCAITWDITLVTRGASRWICFMGINISMESLLYLYIPLYGAVLYFYRNCTKKEIWKVLLYLILPLYLAIQLAHLSLLLNLVVILFSMFTIGIAKGWFGIARTEKKKRMIAIGIVITVFGMIIATIFHSTFLKAYQIVRIQAWLHPEAYGAGAGYVVSIIRNILNTSQLVGRNTIHTWEGNSLNYTSNYILTYLIGEFGVLAAIALILLVLMFGIKLLQICMKQKNQLGMMMGLGCSFVFLIQSVEYILVNLGLLPPSGVYFPLISFGGNGMLQTCILLGILLSIYRYQDVVSEPGHYAA